MRIEGNAFLVSGGGSGLGAATADWIAGQGGRVAVLDRNADAARAVADRVGGLAVCADVTDEAQVIAALEAAEAAQGPLRGLVMCAGIGGGARVLGRDGPQPLAKFEAILRVNLLGSFNVLRLAAARMQAAPATTEGTEADGERGVIVMTASLAAYDGQIGQAAYAASKGGIVSMTLPIAREFARWGIRVVTIAPGLFRTPLMAELSPEALAAITRDIQFPPRLGEPAEFAALAGAVLTNPYLNGEVIRLDGAARLSPR